MNFLERFRGKKEQIKEPEKISYHTFPGFKKDFSTGAFGASGFDLANAFDQRVVKTGDILEITTEYLGGGKREYEIRKVTYLVPETHIAGRNGFHKILDDNPDDLLAGPTTQGGIIHWRKIGRSSLQDLEKISKFVNG